MKGESKKDVDVISDLGSTEKESDSVDDFAVVPEPADGEAVKEALDIAQSFGGLKENKTAGGTFHINSFDDSISLSEYIYEAEKRSQALFEPANADQGPLEDLDILSIAAEFGRPDDSSEEDEEVSPQDEEVSHQYEEREQRQELLSEDSNVENTRNLIIKYKNSHLSGIPEGEVGEDLRVSNGTPLASSASMSIVDEKGATEPQRSIHIVPELTLPKGGKDFGNLAEVELVDLLLASYLDNESGMLILKDAHVTCRLFIQQGEIVTAESNNPELSFAIWLKNEGYLEGKEYSVLQREVSSLNTLQRGAALVSRGIIGPRDMNRLLRKYYEAIVLDTFKWRSGTWRFEQNNHLSPGDTSVLIESPTPAIILQGMLAHASTEMVSNLVPQGSVLRKTQAGVCKLAELGLDNVGRSLLDSCDGTLRVWNRILRNRYESDRYHRLLAALVKLQFIELETDSDAEDESNTTALSSRSPTFFEDAIYEMPGGHPPIELQLPRPGTAPNLFDDSESNAYLPSEQASGNDQFREAEASAGMSAGIVDLSHMVMMKMKAVRQGSYYDILDIDDAATLEEMEAQRRRLLTEFDIVRFSAEGLAVLEADVRLVRTIVDEAYEVLTHPTVAQLYRRAQYSGGGNSSW